jgi:hypothetical protein
MVKLSLSLAMSGIFTDNPHSFFSADHFAVHADFFYGGSNFHI